MGKKRAIIVAVILILIAAAAAVYYFYLKPKPPEEAAQELLETSPAAKDIQKKEEIEPIEVELNQSDDLVRNLVKELSSNPGLARWLMTDHLIRRFVSAVDLVANGDSPRIPADFVDLGGNFQVSGDEGKIFINEKSYARYNRVAEIIASLDAEGFVKLYKQLRLPIKQAYRELKKAITELLETPVPKDRIYLDRDVLTYTMTNPDLENLSAAQKHLLRMGPENVQVIQEKLRQIAQQLGYSN